MARLIPAAVVVLSAVSLPGVHAQTPAAPNAGPAKIEEVNTQLEMLSKQVQLEEKKKELAEKTAQSLKSQKEVVRERAAIPAPFSGLGFGVGISVTFDTGKHDRVSDATVVNGIVRVNKVSNSIPRVLAETHYFFSPEGNIPFFPSMSNRLTEVDASGRKDDDGRPLRVELPFSEQRVNWGIGPFIAIQPGSDTVIDAVGAGLMLGLKRKGDPTDNSSFNIGIGYILDPSVKILGEGIERNKPLPAGESDVRYRTTSQGGVLALVSFSF